MGNCLNTNKVASQEHANINYNTHQLMPQGQTILKKHDKRRGSKNPCVEGGGKRKMVRFKLCANNDNDCENQSNESAKGSVKIKVVLTKEELKQILRNGGGNGFKCCDPVEKLVRELRLRELRKAINDQLIQAASDGCGWSPALESIPECE